MSSTARHFERGPVSGLFPVGQPSRTSPEMSLSLKCSEVKRKTPLSLNLIFPPLSTQLSSSAFTPRSGGCRVLLRSPEPPVSSASHRHLRGILCAGGGEALRFSPGSDPGLWSRFLLFPVRVVTLEDGVCSSLWLPPVFLRRLCLGDFFLDLVKLFGLAARGSSGRPLGLRSGLLATPMILSIFATSTNLHLPA
ncbi:hypothetical protein F2Q69_00047560 [Brassica cretica]|uniref:Uncharacterized protein n=1 Tax=Brassica cretica TaxID=69181 RepID=A0A8S9PQM0_BRACR|nr:hypothetical protein F2Q69_00047560 [Brassica cretica]